MNLINSLYTPSYLLPLIIMLATIIILMIATHMARYGDTTIPLLIGILLLSVNVGAIIYTNYKTDDLLHQPITQNFVVTKHNNYLTIESKNDNFRSAMVKIVDENDNKYLVEYEGQLKKVDK